MRGMGVGIGVEQGAGIRKRNWIRKRQGLLSKNVEMK